MATLEEKVETLELPRPLENELLDSYARRVALIGAHVGVAHALTHQAVAVIHTTGAGEEAKHDEREDRNDGQ